MPTVKEDSQIRPLLVGCDAPDHIALSLRHHPRIDNALLQHRVPFYKPHRDMVTLDGGIYAMSVDNRKGSKLD